jgi:hypothetical protein
MNALRRTAVLIGLAAAVIVGSSLPASATFGESVTLAAKPTITAATVTAPATITPTGYCSTTTSSYWNGYTTVYTTSYWYNATVTWSASTARGVTGYRIVAYLNNGQSFVMGQTDAVNRSVSATVDRSYLAYQPTISVTTLTSYGWATESARKAMPTC